MDPQPWWEVDLGQLCIIQDIAVWNRQIPRLNRKGMNLLDVYFHFGL